MLVSEQMSQTEKKEHLMNTVFSKWNRLKREMVLKDEVPTIEQRTSHESEFYKTMMSLELTLRSLQREIRSDNVSGRGDK